MVSDAEQNRDRDRPRLLDIEVHRDGRGALVALEARGNLPFDLKRAFFIFDVPPREVRAGHATTCRQLLVALRGSCAVDAGQGAERQSFHLGSPARALYVAKGEWLSLHGFSADALLAVLADEPYTPR